MEEAVVKVVNIAEDARDDFSHSREEAQHVCAHGRVDPSPAMNGYFSAAEKAVATFSKDFLSSCWVNSAVLDFLCLIQVGGTAGLPRNSWAHRWRLLNGQIDIELDTNRNNMMA